VISQLRSKVVRHRDIQDPDCGRFMVKVYHSERAVTADGCSHTRIILKPDTRACWNAGKWSN